MIEEADATDLDAWPAFVDLLSATSLLFLTLLIVWIYLGHARTSGTATQIELLASRLKAADPAQARYRVTSDSQIVVVTLEEEATFAKDSASLTSLRDAGRQSLRQLGAVLADTGIARLYRSVQIVGHTDQQPYAAVSANSNWELSARRAAVVARFLLSETELDPCRVLAAGRGPYYPLQEHAEIARLQPAERARNRRIEIEIVPARQSAAPDGRCYARGDGTGNVR